MRRELIYCLKPLGGFFAIDVTFRISICLGVLSRYTIQYCLFLERNKMSNEGKRVRAHYVGTFDDGTVFDSSVERPYLIRR